MTRDEAAQRMFGALSADERFNFMQDFSIDQGLAMMRAAFDALGLERAPEDDAGAVAGGYAVALRDGAPLYRFTLDQREGR